MTDDQPNDLDRARAKEAIKRAFGKYGTCSFTDAAIEAAYLARTNWEPIDPDLLAVREIVAKAYEGNSPMFAAKIRNGKHDIMDQIEVGLAAYKAGKEAWKGGL